MTQEYLDLPPLLFASGTVTLPGSKSISNRVLLLAALSEGETVVRDLLDSDDTARMLEGLQTLGVKIEALGGNAYRVHGCGGNFPVKDARLFLGNAGTAFRPLTAALAFSGGDYILEGVPRMHERPIKDLVDALRQLGADISYLENEGFPPLEIRPARPAGDIVSVRGDVSSQFLTGLLMALPLTGKTVKVEVIGELISRPYIEITLSMMQRFGVEVERHEWQSFVVSGPQRYRSPGTIYVEGDASSASYFLAAGAIGGGPVRVEGVGQNSVQGDLRFAEALQMMGAEVSMGDNFIEASAPAGGQLRAIDLDCNHIPDAAMTLAVMALYAKGTTTLRNIASWRVKETDRIAAMAKELRKVGATVDEGQDYISITAPEKIRYAEIDTYDDHRMAMCFSLAAFGSAVRINDPKCVAKTFPDYFERFARVTRRVPVIAIDGPSASGKGTVAGLVAKQLGFSFLDSGALYRIAALAAIRGKIPLENAEAVAQLISSIEIAFEGDQIRLDGDNVTEAIRSEQCGNGASIVAAHPQVREALLEKQREFRRAPGLVADGRDMASVVFPDAMLKIFLTASAEERANRRYKQLMAKGINANIESILHDIRQRDERDSSRSVAPLQKNADAELLDTTSIGIDDAVNRVLRLFAAASAKGN